jgi:hypothetical protein
MMKLFTSIFASIFLFQTNFGQNIGIRSNIEFSDNEKINFALGGGSYLNINDFSEKIELLFFTDYYSNKKQLPSQEMITTYRLYSFGVSSLYKFSLSKYSNFKLGPSISYDLMDASEAGMVFNWIRTYDSKSIGVGLISNFQFPQVKKLPINFDIFITPTYLINIKNDTSPLGNKSDFLENQKIVNVQLGISYII